MCSPQYRVAAIGKLATHPGHRGCGHAKRVTGALCGELLQSVDQVGLNVKVDNAAGIHCCERLGFETAAQYDG